MCFGDDVWKAKPLVVALKSQALVACSAGLTACFFESARREKIVVGPDIVAEGRFDMSLCLWEKI